ncbi:MAG: VOC family protein [Alphaproteobacteria bacterium]
MKIAGFHHVAYRCNSAKDTIEFYTNILGMKYVMAISEERVPSTNEENPYMHIFFETGDAGYLAFFELPESPPMGRDPNTPDWVQHLAFKVADEETLMAYKAKIEDAGIEVLGPTDHTIFQSIYFRDPSGHRIELAYNSGSQKMWDELATVAKPMMEEWEATGKVVKQAAWLHERQLAAADES